MKKVILFFANGTEEVEALTAVDLLRRAGAELTVAGIGGKELTGSHGIRIIADVAAEEIASFDYDMVVLPGGLPGTTHLDESPIVDRMLSEVHKNGGHLAAICAAPLVLGKRGYLKGKKAVCYPGFESYLLEAVKPREGTRVCTDGKIVTGAGAGVATEFALALIMALYGAEASENIRRTILAD